MDNKILKILLAIAALPIIWRLFKGHKQQRFVGAAFITPKAGQAYYTLTPSSREVLKCRYFASGILRQQGKYAAGLINERMILLQAKEPEYQDIVARGKRNGWTAYETLYRDAIQQLLREDIIEYAPDNACQDGDGGISVGQVSVGP